MKYIVNLAQRSKPIRDGCHFSCRIPVLSDVPYKYTTISESTPTMHFALLDPENVLDPLLKRRIRPFLFI